jgi:ketosteroid isomerase-like protein
VVIPHCSQNESHSTALKRGLLSSNLLTCPLTREARDLLYREALSPSVPAKSPEEICRLFQRYMAEGDVESLLSIYDSEAVVLTQSGEAKKGQGLREQLASVAAAKPQFDFNIRQVIQSGEIALMHTDWKVSSPQQMFEYAIEVARRQPDGTWRWLIGDPFTVGKRTAMETKIA